MEMGQYRNDINCLSVIRLDGFPAFVQHIMQARRLVKPDLPLCRKYSGYYRYVYSAENAVLFIPGPPLAFSVHTTSR
jgi:hypothetical protein